MGTQDPDKIMTVIRSQAESFLDKLSSISDFSMSKNLASDDCFRHFDSTPILRTT